MHGNSSRSCLESCQNFDKCSWMSYEENFQECLLFQTCHDIDVNQNYVSGQKECLIAGK